MIKGILLNSNHTGDEAGLTRSAEMTEIIIHPPELKSETEIEDKMTQLPSKISKQVMEEEVNTSFTLESLFPTVFPTEYTFRENIRTMIRRKPETLLPGEAMKWRSEQMIACNPKIQSMDILKWRSTWDQVALAITTATFEAINGRDGLLWERLKHKFLYQMPPTMALHLIVLYISMHLLSDSYEGRKATLIEYSYLFLDEVDIDSLCERGRAEELLCRIAVSDRHNDIALLFAIICMVCDDVIDRRERNQHPQVVFNGCRKTIARFFKNIDNALHLREREITLGVKTIRDIDYDTIYVMTRLVTFIDLLNGETNEQALTGHKHLIFKTTMFWNSAILCKVSLLTFLSILDNQRTRMCKIINIGVSDERYALFETSEDSEVKAEQRLYTVLTKKGYKYTLRIFIWPLLALMVGSTLFILISGLTKKSYMTFEGVDPTSMTSLYVVLEGLFLAFIVATFHEDWSWYDMIRGQLYVPDYELLPLRVRMKYDVARFLHHVYTRQDDYKELISRYGACYIKSEVNGKYTLPLRMTVASLIRCGCAFGSTMVAGKETAVYMDSYTKSFYELIDMKGNLLHVSKKIELDGKWLLKWYPDDTIVAADDLHSDVFGRNDLRETPEGRFVTKQGEAENLDDSSIPE